MSRTKYEHENITLWDYLMEIMPYLEGSEEYGDYILSDSIAYHNYIKIKGIITQKKHDIEMKGTHGQTN